MCALSNRAFRLCTTSPSKFRSLCASSDIWHFRQAAAYRSTSRFQTSLPSPLPYPLDESTFHQLRESLLTRELPLLYDTVSSTPLHSLEVTLSDFVKPDTPLKFRAGQVDVHIPFAKHLVYFPPQDALSQLLPDATDPLQSPGQPFDRRMWAGGRIIQVSGHHANSLFAHSATAQNNEHTTPAAICLERIADVKLKGSGEQQKIFVTLERRIGRFKNSWTGQKAREMLLNDFRQSAVIERRDLVFMTLKSGDLSSKESQNAKTKTAPRVLKAPHAPDYSVSLMPTASLLFRFSGLTFNAHRIHLDMAYCRDIEGHRGLLVHGPLSCTLMTQVLSQHIRQSFGTDPDASSAKMFIKDFTYRNLAPLYSDESLKVCVRRKPQNLVLDAKKQALLGNNISSDEKPDGLGQLADIDEIYSEEGAEGVVAAEGASTFAQFECWVENQDGSMCVRGNAICQTK